MNRFYINFVSTGLAILDHGYEYLHRQFNKSSLIKAVFKTLFWCKVD